MKIKCYTDGSCRNKYGYKCGFGGWAFSIDSNMDLYWKYKFIPISKYGNFNL